MGSRDWKKHSGTSCSLGGGPTSWNMACARTLGKGSTCSCYGFFVNARGVDVGGADGLHKLEKCLCIGP